MLVRDVGGLPKDDYTNLDLLEKGKIIDKETKATIAEANGLRNRIVQGYNGLNHELAHRSIFNLLGGLEDFTVEVSRWLSKRI